MEEERVVRTSVLHQPVHCPQYVLFCGLAHRILLVIGEDDHVVSLIAKVVVQESRHVLDIVYTTTKLPPLSEIVDSNQQSLPPSRTV